MKKYLNLFILSLMCAGYGLFAQKTKTKLPESKFFTFQSNPMLNAHLFLYNKAMGCKFKKVHADSLAYYSFKDKVKLIKPAELSALNGVLAYYKDSLLGKDLLFDSLMRDFSDKLSASKTTTNLWQLLTVEKINVFKPLFLKLYWPGIEAENKSWLSANTAEVVRLEAKIVDELENIYETRLPQSKIIIDLTSYATWAGAYSFNDTYCHVIFSSSHLSNQGSLAPEVVFHETSHFLVDKLSFQIAELAKNKNIKQTVGLWHNIIFYTTGHVMQKYYTKEGKTFVPYYVEMKFAEKFPEFRTSVEVCKLYWVDHIEGKTDMLTSVKGMVGFMQEKK